MDENTQRTQVTVDSFEELTGRISPVPARRTEPVADRIRRVRETSGLSLEELSKLTGFETDQLSKIETKEVEPQLGTVIQLSRALNSAFARMVSETGEELCSVTRCGDRQIVPRSTAADGQEQPHTTYRSLAPGVRGRHMEALVVHLQGSPGPEPSVHEGEEFIYVLEGVALLTIGDQGLVLQPGDSAYFLSTTPHQIRAQTGEATVLAVIYQG